MTGLMEVRYISFCPFGDVCKKGCARLGSDKSEEDCRWRICNHLHTSQYHNMPQADAHRESLIASVETEEVELPPEGGDAGKGKGKDAKGQGKDAKGDRPAPYNQPKGKGKGKSQGWWQSDEAWSSAGTDWHDAWRAAPAESSSSGGSSAALQLVATKPDNKTLQSLAKCEAAMRTAARMARSAALAFEEEAAVLASEINRMGN